MEPSCPSPMTDTANVARHFSHWALIQLGPFYIHEDTGSAAVTMTQNNGYLNKTEVCSLYMCYSEPESRPDVVPLQCWGLRYLLSLFFLLCTSLFSHYHIYILVRRNQEKVITLPLKGTMRRSYTGFWLTFYVHTWQKVNSKL